MVLNSLDDDGAILNIVLYGRSSSRCLELFSSFINTVCQDVEATEMRLINQIRYLQSRHAVNQDKPWPWINIKYSEPNLEIMSWTWLSRSQFPIPIILLEMWILNLILVVQDSRNWKLSLHTKTFVNPAVGNVQISVHQEGREMEMLIVTIS